jgi:hypothetical protein
MIFFSFFSSTQSSGRDDKGQHLETAKRDSAEVDCNRKDSAGEGLGELVCVRRDKVRFIILLSHLWCDFDLLQRIKALHLMLPIKPIKPIKFGDCLRELA